MGVEKGYADEVRENLQLFPVWMPGASTVPGEIGELDRGIFVRQGDLAKQFGLNVIVKNQEHFLDQHLFQSEGASFGDVSADTAIASSMNASVDVKFTEQGAVVFHAEDISQSYIENLHQVRRQIEDLKKMKAWPDGYVLVSHVQTAARFAVYVSKAQNDTLKLSGLAEALTGRKVADASVTAGDTSKVGYAAISHGPILLKLYGFGWLGRKTRDMHFAPQMAEDGEQLSEISAEDPAHDDPAAPRKKRVSAPARRQPRRTS